jgi:1,4-dihydroxy-2-naphthoate polyprenyltransferase
MLANPGPGAPEPAKFWPIWIGAARPRTLPAAVAPVLMGSALAAHDGRFEVVAAVLCLGFALLVQVGTNFANDYYDFVNGADTAARVGPRRAVAAGLVSPAQMRRVMFAVFAAAFGLGLSLIAWGGPWLLVVGLSSIAAGIAYTGGPFPLGYRGLGDLLVFIFFGLVAVNATYFVQTGTVTADGVLAAVPIGLLAANILLVNNYRDAETDAVAGKRTLVVRLGRGWARVQFIASLAMAAAMPEIFWTRGYRPWCLLPLLLLPWGFAQARRLNTHASAPELIRLLGDSGKLLALYAALFGLGLLL